ncbi:hypothetical protein Syun_006060 [Stephania yunnanensis]|uniref:Uncharacterized protein n=1 Tax=Stephania yunnanensis TaxID=152371 RepID=A0AAP0KZA6_9MAGN
MGLIPKGVSEFSLDSNGRFEVYLDRPCNARFESVVHYEKNVSGTLSYGQIQGLSGISAQELFLWFPVKGIRVDIPSSGLIYFDVGVIYKQFSLSSFETPRDCKVDGNGNGGLVSGQELREGEVIQEIVSKSRSGKHWYELDQEYVGNAVVE